MISRDKSPTLFLIRSVKEMRKNLQRGSSLERKETKKMKAQGRFLVAIFYLSYAQLVVGKTLPDCQENCGNVVLEYPFGVSPHCYYAEEFKLSCVENKTLFLGRREVVSISHRNQIRVLFPISIDCYNSQGLRITNFTMAFFVSTFPLSENNMLTAVGCNTIAVLATNGVRNYSAACISVCDSGSPLVANSNKCEGQGCCQNPVPAGTNRFSLTAYPFNNLTSTSKIWVDFSTNHCTYAFVVENGTYKFKGEEDFKNLEDVKGFPVVLDWYIRNKNCNEADLLCGENSICKNTTSEKGYVCKCIGGYDGNPYLKKGCQDINECTTNKYNCPEGSICVNMDGNYKCKCPSGNLISNDKKCTPDGRPKYVEWTGIFLGTTIGFLAILLAVRCIKQRMKHRKDTELRQQFFEQNGGGMLIQRLSGAGPSNVDIKIFSEEGMKTATNGYDKSRILGEGGQGTVYKGILPDKSIVAIKKARLGDCSQVEQFINEVLVLSQINHRNVVKLLGCCLETEVPLLVYEFITNGTLFDHLHGSMFDSSLTWEHRLRIAIEVAGTLSYLHSSASIPIIHRDIKTANILLDENLTAKVADFGASRLIPMDKEQLTTMVQGTLGYLDPEYYNTGLLNEKSDVYSFGVVLMELLSGQKALCFERPQYSKHLVSYVASAIKENRLHEIIDGLVMNEDNQREIQEAARIAVECTRLTGEERPRMKEVTAELEALRVTKTKHKWSDQYPEAEDVEHLVGVQILSTQGETSGTGYDSIKTVAILDIEAGR